MAGPRVAVRRRERSLPLAELRRLLRAAGGATIEAADGGYLLVCQPELVDAQHLVTLVLRARAYRQEGANADAARALSEALALWRGEIMAGVPVPDLVLPAAERLADLRITAMEELVAARLALHEQHEILPDLMGLVVEHPLRETLWHQLLLALWADGRGS